MNSEDFFKMINAMAKAFVMIGGSEPNELWAHPKTINELKWADNQQPSNLPYPRFISLSANGEFRYYTDYGLCKLREDASILPGVIYLDVNAEHTSNSRNQRRQRYYTADDFIGKRAYSR